MLSARSGFTDEGLTFPDGSGGSVSPPGELPVAGYLPLLVDKQWRNAALLNSVDYDGPAWAIYRDDRLPSRVGYRTWENRLPSGSGPVPNAMPKANVAATWGDYLVLGDIVWKADPSKPLDEGNAARYPHALWFSEPGAFDKWDELEVQFTGQRSGGNRVVGLFPVEAGLLVASTSGMYLFRGTPQENSKEELRVGVGPSDQKKVTYWPLKGTVVWMDARGQVWQTDGETFSRLDDPLPEPPNTWNPEPPDPQQSLDSVTAIDEYLLVSRGGRLFALYAAGERGAWSELNGPAAAGLYSFRGSMYSRSGQGLYRWGLQLPGQRGQRDRQPVASEVVTPTLAGSDPHEVSFWHRFGVRVSSADMVAAESIAGPASVGALPSLTYREPDVSPTRQQVLPAHGPSVEASFRWRFLGDVTFEAVTVWVHRGRPER